jgi:tRNA (Thr-GGU) A37 N-methylase
MSSQSEIVLKPIGVVRTAAVGGEVKDKTRISRIVIHNDLAEALDGIEDFSHLFVLFRMSCSVNSVKSQILLLLPLGFLF